VFKAIYRNQNVVIKALHPSKLHDKMISDEFFFEAEILARVDHPNIVHGWCFLIFPSPLSTHFQSSFIFPLVTHTYIHSSIHSFIHSFIHSSFPIFSIYTASGSGSDPLPFLVLEELKPLPQFFNLQGPEAAVFDFTTVIGFAKELSSAMLYLHEGTSTVVTLSTQP